MASTDKRVAGRTVVFHSYKEFEKALERFEQFSLKQAVKRGKEELPEYLKEVEKRAARIDKSR